MLRSPGTVLVLLLLLSACVSGANPPGGADPAGAAPTLRVLSFNVDGEARGEDHPRRWSLRRDAVASQILEARPHILGLQEVFRPQLDQLAAALPGFGEVGVGSIDGMERGEYTAILYDRNRLELLDGGTFWISELWGTPGSKHFGNALPRTATWGRFRDLREGSVFLAVNVRLDDVAEPARELGVEVLQERILAMATAAGSVILMGDFGAGEDTRSFRVVQAASVPVLVDTFRLLHPTPAPGGTLHDYAGGVDGPRRGAILASLRFRPVAAGILDDPEEGAGGPVHPSDHHPVWAELSWTP
jgi:endonuclease/exonuclease/phosphatase family metal-dependent hydrolase